MIFIRLRLLFLRHTSVMGPCFYIGGVDVLPAPLKGEEEQKALEDLEKGEPAAKRKLIECNLRLVVYIAKRFENTGINLEDLISIGTIGLIKAISTYNREKNIKLATYGSRCIENEILMYIRKVSVQKSEVSLDEPINTDYDGNEMYLSDIIGSEEDEIVQPLEREAELEVLRNAVNELPKREKEIIVMRYGLYGRKELTQKEVALKMGISQSYISRLEKKVMLKLRNELLVKTNCV